MNGVMKKLLILDIDETLLHATEKPLKIPHDFMFSHYFVYLRPHLKELLEYCNEHFMMAVWTAGNQAYADAVVEHVFEPDFPLEFVWSRQRCTPRFNPEDYKHIYLKNLSKVKHKGYPLDHTIMVDNTPEKLVKNYGNLVRVADFRGEPDDNEFRFLRKYLDQLKDVPNIRTIEKRGWKKNLKASS